MIGTSFFVFRMIGVVYGYSALAKEMRDLNVHSIGPGFWGARAGSAQYVTNERLHVLMDLRYTIGTWGVFDTIIYFMIFLFMQSDRWIPTMAFEVMLVFFYVFLTFIMRSRKYRIFPLEDASSEVERPLHNENVLRRAAQMINTRNNSNNNDDDDDDDIVHGIN